MRKSLHAALVAASLTAGGAAAADPATVRIRHGDLDLASPAGRAVFDRRVRAAATRICGTPPVMDDPTFWAVSDCRAQVIRSGETGVAVTLASGRGDALIAGTR